jgi:hypothetical protein
MWLNRSLFHAPSTLLESEEDLIVLIGQLPTRWNIESGDLIALNHDRYIVVPLALVASPLAVFSPATYMVHPVSLESWRKRHAINQVGGSEPGSRRQYLYLVIASLTKEPSQTSPDDETVELLSGKL